MAKPKTGDKVKIITEDNEFEGTLMPRPELFDKNHTIVKLDSGYNFGLSNDKIKSIELIEAYKPKEIKESELKHNPKLKSVSILSTGGTISSRIDYKTGGTYADYTAKDFVEMCPELQDVANLKAKVIMSIMSEDENPHDWLKIAKEIVNELKDEKTDGVVLTMGTDTLHYAAAALSFLIQDINKPVIITASQRSIDRGSSDAFMNLICSVNAAANFDYAGVATCLHGTSNDDYCLINRGTKVRKMHTSMRSAFRPINEKPLGKVFLEGKIEYINENIVKRNSNTPKAVTKYEHDVALVYIYPGIKPEIIDFHVKAGYKALVLGATALGHIPGEIHPAVKNAIDKGVHVIIATQTLYGKTNPYVYTNLRKLSVQLGCIYTEDTLMETAYVKAGYVLGQTSDKEKVKELMQTNIAGEMNPRHNDDFLY